MGSFRNLITHYHQIIFSVVLMFNESRKWLFFEIGDQIDVSLLTKIIDVLFYHIPRKKNKQIYFIKLRFIIINKS